MMRCNGGWSWWLEDSGHRTVCGSCVPATEIAKAPYVIVYKSSFCEPELFSEKEPTKDGFKNL